MKKIICHILIILILVCTIIMQVLNQRRIHEVSVILGIQSEVEVKQTGLMVIYQEVLQNLVREVDELKKIPENQDGGPGKLDFGLPGNIGEQP